MDTFPIASLSRAYALGTPHWRPIDSGVAAQRVGSGILRTRARLGQAVHAVDLQFFALSAADRDLLVDFYEDNRAETFYWPDWHSMQTYVCVFDPDGPARPYPSATVPGAWDVAYTLLPLVPTEPVDMLVLHFDFDVDLDGALLMEDGTDFTLIDNSVLELSSTGLPDGSEFGYDATVSPGGSAMITTGKLGTALHFDISEEHYVRIADADELRLTHGGTILLWVKPVADYTLTDGRVPRLFSRGWYYNLWTSAAGLRLTIGSGSGNITTAPALTAGSWQHLAVVIGQTKIIYVNGADVTTAAGDDRLPANGSGALFLGAYNATGGFFEGDIDDFRLYRRPLSKREIEAIYNSGAGTAATVIA